MGVLDLARQIDYYLDPFEMSQKPSERRDLAFALNLKMQAIMLKREGIGDCLPDLKVVGRECRRVALDMLNKIVPLPDKLFNYSTYEVVDDGYSYYDFSSYDSDFRRLSELSIIMSEYDEFLSRDELEDALSFYEDEEYSEDDILDIYDEVSANSNSPALLSFLQWVSDVGFESSIEPKYLLPEWQYFLSAYAPGGYTRIVKSIIIEGLNLEDSELQDEIHAVAEPLSCWYIEPVLLQVGEDVLLSYTIPTESCYELDEELERPLWRLACKMLEEELLKRKGESA